MDIDTGWIGMSTVASPYEVEYHPPTDQWRHRIRRASDSNSTHAYRAETEWFPGRPKT